jgi:hypothetical protein
MLVLELSLFVRQLDRIHAVSTSHTYVILIAMISSHYVHHAVIMIVIVKLILLISIHEGNALHVLSKKYPTIFFPAVSNGERVGKLNVVVEGTFRRTHDFLLPRNTAHR